MYDLGTTRPKKHAHTQLRIAREGSGRLEKNVPRVSAWLRVSGSERDVRLRSRDLFLGSRV